MRKRKRPATPLPLLLGELTLASWETIFRRSLMMAQGTCSWSEYWRMVDEKMHAAHQSGRALARHGSADPAKLLSPWHRRATANARRLRK